MGKKRSIWANSEAVAFEHPDGGTLYISPMSFDERGEYAAIAFGEYSFEYDADGKIVFNQNSGDPCKRFNIGKTAEKQLELALAKVSRIDDVEREDGKPFEQTPENFRAVLCLSGTDQVEFNIDLDQKGEEFTGAKGQKKSGKTARQKRPVTEPYYQWALRKSAQLTLERSGLERKN